MKEFRVVLCANIAGGAMHYESPRGVGAYRTTACTLDRLRHIVSAHGGLVIKISGDGLACRFAQAGAALLAAEAMQTEQSRLRNHLSLCIALHGGDAPHHENDLSGTMMHVAAQLAELAKPGQILLSESTSRHLDDWMRLATRSVGAVNVQGSLRPVPLVEVLHDQSAELTLI